MIKLLVYQLHIPDDRCFRLFYKISVNRNFGIHTNSLSLSLSLCTYFVPRRCGFMFCIIKPRENLISWLPKCFMLLCMYIEKPPYLCYNMLRLKTETKQNKTKKISFKLERNMLKIILRYTILFANYIFITIPNFYRFYESLFSTAVKRHQIRHHMSCNNKQQGSA